VGSKGKSSGYIYVVERKKWRDAPKSESAQSIKLAVLIARLDRVGADIKTFNTFVYLMDAPL
jgi:hypothetical protein